MFDATIMFVCVFVFVNLSHEAQISASYGLKLSLMFEITPSWVMSQMPASGPNSSFLAQISALQLKSQKWVFLIDA